MATKKSVKKKTVRKKTAARPAMTARSVNKTEMKTAVLPMTSGSISKRIGIAVKNLILFAVLSIISYMLYLVSSSQVYMDLFWLLAVILFFIAVAFLIVLLVFLLLKLVRK